MKPPCTQNCDMREPLRQKYGNCHNEHCPYGWKEYEDGRDDYYKEKAMRNVLNQSSPSRIRIARKKLEVAKRK